MSTDEEKLEPKPDPGSQTGSQKSESKPSQKSDLGSQKSDPGSQKSDPGSKKSDPGSPKSDPGSKPEPGPKSDPGSESGPKLIERPLPRWSLTLAAGAHGLIFAWAARALPWSQWSFFALICGLLALGHLATAAMAAGRLRPLAWTWRATSVLGLVVFGWLAWELTQSASYLAGLYGDLGAGLGTLMMGVLGLLAVLTVPLSLWGLAATWDTRWNRGAGAAAAVLALCWVGGSWRTAEAAQAVPVPVPVGDGSEGLANIIADGLPDWNALPEISLTPPPARAGKPERRAPDLRLPALLVREPVACVPVPGSADGSAEAYAVLTYMIPASDETLERRRRSVPGRRLAAVEPVSRCVTAEAEALPEAIAEQLRAEAMRGPIKIDVITGVVLMRSQNFILDMFALRPGLDGICDADRCLMPWQLIASSEFQVNEPLGWIPDFRFGVSPMRLQRGLGGTVSREIQTWDRQRRRPKTRKKEDRDQPLITPEGAAEWSTFDGLLRIETMSMAVSPGGRVMALARLHERELTLSQARLDHARTLAEAHIAAAQLPEGRFTYTLDPFTGKRRTKAWNLPRQAGTTLVMCERGQDPVRTKAVAERSLNYMAEHARESGELVALIRNTKSDDAHLGSTALPTIAFLSCRGRVGDLHDPLIAGLVRFLLAMQREDGSFYPKFDVASGVVIDGPEPMYAGGQVLFSLSLAEKLALEDPARAAEVGLPSAERLHEALERGMDFYTGPYWDTILRDFFWLEENWHCLAARASLGHHRNDAYEQFCIDYMAYKARVPMTAQSHVAAEFIGGYSMGNILTPVNTPAAGFGEGLAAAMALKEARGEDISADREQMKTVLEFLVRQQWNEETCFACDPHQHVVGGFSESMSAPEIRIDYTQHAWAALGHGGDWIRGSLPARVGNDDGLLGDELEIQE